MGHSRITQKEVDDSIPIIENRLPIYNWLVSNRNSKNARKVKLLGQMRVAHELGIINSPLAEYTLEKLGESLDNIEDLSSITYARRGFRFKRKYSEATVEDYKRLLKQFFAYYEKHDKRISYSVAELLLLHSDKESQHRSILAYEQKKKVALALYNKVKEIRINKKKAMKKKTREGLLTVADYHLMIANTNSYYLKAMVTTLFFTGIRIGALMRLKISDIDMSGEIWKISLHDKGDTRRTVPAIEIKSAVQDYLTHYHPNPVPNSPLWVSANNRAYGEPIKATSVRTSLRKLKKTIQKVNPGWNKEVNPHHFRHSWTTRNKNLVSDHVLKRMGGWTKDSKAIYHYDHLNDNDIIQEVSKAYGIEVQNNARLMWDCSNCHKENLLSQLYCECGTPQSSLLIESNKNQLTEQNKLTKQFFDKLMGDPELLARFQSFLSG